MSDDQTTTAGEWREDPDVPGRQRYHDGSNWTAHVSANGETSTEPYLGGAPRWQHALVSIGTGDPIARMTAALTHLSPLGWELTEIHERSKAGVLTDNQYGSGVLIFRRPVVAGQALADDEWVKHVKLTD